MDEIVVQVKYKFVWVQIDETTDSMGRYVANFMMGILSSDEEEAKKVFLVNVGFLGKTNHVTIAQFFNETIKLLGNEFDAKNILLFLSDAAPYMVKALGAIKTFYPKILHVTCLDHGIQRVAEKISLMNPTVDKLVSTVKKLFLKSPIRTQTLKELYPDLALPPQPILTRWGTWIEAVRYYAENFEKIVDVIDHLNDDDSVAITTAKQMITDAQHKQRLKNDLISIHSNYGFIPKHIKKLETRGMKLTDSVGIVIDSLQKIKSVHGQGEIKVKLDDVIKKNAGFHVIQKIFGVKMVF